MWEGDSLCYILQKVEKNSIFKFLYKCTLISVRAETKYI